MAVEILSSAELPKAASRVSSSPRIPALPLESLDVGQGARVPFADLGGIDIDKAHGTIRVRAHRAGSKLNRTFRVHRGTDAFFVSRWS